ncbi:hypothetical protein FQA47_021213 [Oryzias melastigma]|uniref:Uncharacterized protein n=1 Tax=Oryzias melastigma TaxID=30732 RepID=A0A834FDR6_ORYME|nr:hypothetical protein FQA47_021213 [Oryzias melastigma]
MEAEIRLLISFGGPSFYCFSLLGDGHQGVRGVELVEGRRTSSSQDAGESKQYLTPTPPTSVFLSACLVPAYRIPRQVMVVTYHSSEDQIAHCRVKKKAGFFFFLLGGRKKRTERSNKTYFSFIRTLHKEWSELNEHFPSKVHFPQQMFQLFHGV